VAKATFRKKKKRLFSLAILLNLRKKFEKHHCRIADLGAEIWTLLNVSVVHKCQGSFEICWWRRMEKISWTNRVRNEQLLQGVKEDSDIVHRVKRRKTYWIGHIVHRNWLVR